MYIKSIYKVDISTGGRTAMSLRFHWFLPANGDGRRRGRRRHPAPPRQAQQTISPFAPMQPTVDKLAAS
jgi:hypothetical protein